MRRTLIVALPLLLVVALIQWRLRGTAPRTADAPESAFSAARAHEVLRETFAEDVAHPIGTAANARVRDRIVDRFRALGYATRIQQRFACNASAVCATVENILAGDFSADAVVLTVHYDSVAAGPGASDDGAGVAALLEIARAVRGHSSRQGFRNPIAFLITDGEEAGLLGAEGFVADAELSRHVAAVIGIEHRGTSGPSFMFETSARNRGLIRHVARGVERPIASSLFATIYDLMPNDTDLTVFKRAGRAGVNFAAVGDVVWYHTPLDDLAHIDLRTLQHQGENALGLARQLADADLAARSSDNAVFFDILGFTILGWPAPWTIWIGGISLAALIVAARRSDARAITLSVLAAFGTIAVAALAGWAIAWIAQLKSSLQWMAMPMWAVLAMWMTGIAAALIPWRRRSADIKPRPNPIGYAMVFHAAAIVLAITLPGPSYLFLVPAVVLSICAIAGASDVTSSVAASVTAAILILPVATLLYTALGSAALPIIAVLVAIVMMLAAPAIADGRAAAIAFALAIACALISIAMPKTTPERPSRLSLAYVDDAAQPQALWMANSATRPMRDVVRFADAPAGLTPWSRYPLRLAAPAPRLPLPRVEITRDGNTLRVRSHRNAQRVMLAFRGPPLLRVNGIAPPPRPARFRSSTAAGWQTVLVYGTSMDVEVASAHAKIEAIAEDVSYGLPPPAAALVRARTASHAVPSHEGDVTVTRSRLHP